MTTLPKIPADWTETEKWVWDKIVAGVPADLNEFDLAPKREREKLNPITEDGWSDRRRLRAKFLQTILTDRALVGSTPYLGVRVVGALIDDATLDLEDVRLPYRFSLHECRILKDLIGNALRVDGDLSLTGCFVNGVVTLFGAKIASYLILSGSTFEGGVNLNGASVGRAVFVRKVAILKGPLDLGAAKIGSNLEMGGSTFEREVYLNGASVGGAALLRIETAFDGAWERTIFKRALDLVSVKIGSNLEMDGSICEGSVTLNGASVNGAVFLREGAIFKGGINLLNAKIGGNLEMTRGTFERGVSATQCTVGGTLYMAYSDESKSRWGKGALFVLCNARVGALQDWWENKERNAWPESYYLEGFEYERLGVLLQGKEEDSMVRRPTASYVEWLDGDKTSSPQPYEQLANRLREAGQPHKSADILYAARKRRFREAWKRREMATVLGLGALQVTIGYGLGYRYFRALLWVGLLTLLGAWVLIVPGSHSWEAWPSVLFASLDQLLPIVTLNEAHDAMVFGDSSVIPVVDLQPYGVLVYFYVHKVLGWILGSFLVAGLSGLTQHN
jgi:hypothetical protein